MSVTIVLTGMRGNVNLAYMASRLKAVFNSDEIGSFSSRHLPRHPRTGARRVALDFNSSYEAMLAQNLLDGLKYEMVDEEECTEYTLRAKLTHDPGLRPTEESQVSHVWVRRASPLPSDLGLAARHRTLISDEALEAHLRRLKSELEIMKHERQIIKERKKLRMEYKKRHEDESDSDDEAKRRKLQSRLKRSRRRSDSSPRIISPNHSSPEPPSSSHKKIRFLSASTSHALVPYASTGSSKERVRSPPTKKERGSSRASYRDRIRSTFRSEWDSDSSDSSEKKFSGSRDRPRSPVSYRDRGRSPLSRPVYSRSREVHITELNSSSGDGSKSPSSHRDRAKSPRSYRDRAKSPRSYRDRARSPGRYRDRARSPGSYQGRERSLLSYCDRARSPARYRDRARSSGSYRDHTRSPVSYRDHTRSPGSRRRSRLKSPVQESSSKLKISTASKDHSKVSDSRHKRLLEKDDTRTHSPPSHSPHSLDLRDTLIWRRSQSRSVTRHRNSTGRQVLGFVGIGQRNDHPSSSRPLDTKLDHLWGTLDEILQDENNEEEDLSEGEVQEVEVKSINLTISLASSGTIVTQRDEVLPPATHRPIANDSVVVKNENGDNTTVIKMEKPTHESPNGKENFSGSDEMLDLNKTTFGTKKKRVKKSSTSVTPETCVVETETPVPDISDCIDLTPAKCQIDGTLPQNLSPYPKYQGPVKMILASMHSHTLYVNGDLVLKFRSIANLVVKWRIRVLLKNIQGSTMSKKIITNVYRREYPVDKDKDFVKSIIEDLRHDVYKDVDLMPLKKKARKEIPAPNVNRLRYNSLKELIDREARRLRNLESLAEPRHANVNEYGDDVVLIENTVPVIQLIDSDGTDTESPPVEVIEPIAEVAEPKAELTEPIVEIVQPKTEIVESEETIDKIEGYVSLVTKIIEIS